MTSSRPRGRLPCQGVLDGASKGSAATAEAAHSERPLCRSEWVLNLLRWLRRGDYGRQRGPVFQLLYDLVEQGFEGFCIGEPGAVPAYGQRAEPAM